MTNSGTVTGQNKNVRSNTASHTAGKGMAVHAASKISGKTNGKKSRRKRPHFDIRKLFRVTGKVIKVISGILIPFLGISYLWNKKCRLPEKLKYAITGVVLAGFVAVIFVIPTPTGLHASGQQDVEEATEVKVYGPSRPTEMNENYVYVSETDSVSVLSTAVSSYEDSVTWVYAVEGQKCYHTEQCAYARDGGKKTLYEAYLLGYTPCNKCEPPVYGEETADADSE